jgi:hypothetical protein
MSDDAALIPIDQRTVEFHGDKLTAVLTEDGTIFVPVKPLCESLDIQWSAQSKRINRDPVLAEVATSVSIMDIQGDPPQRRPMTCLPLDYLNGWLFGVNAARIKDTGTRRRLINYQKECYQVLSRAFGARQLPVTAASASIQALEQVRNMGLAIAHLAEEQIEMELRLTTTEGRLDRAVVVVEQLNERVEKLEQRITPGALVTDDQASQISEAVKTVAIALGKKSGRNEFGAIYGEMYRKFGITGYKQLPASKFQLAMDWLNQWHQDIESNLPF